MAIPAVDAPAVMGPVLAALIGGSVAAAATAVGTIPAWFARGVGPRLQDALLGFGAGVMLAASAFSLILPGLDAAREQGAGSWEAGIVVGLAVLVGGAMIMLLDRAVPHEHFVKGPEGAVPGRLRRTWLFVFAIALHNLPEGLAIGTAYATDIGRGHALATGIALQDIPEGLVVAMALVAAGVPRLRAVLVGMASGLVEPVGAVAGAGLVVALPLLLPVGLGFAAGAMLFVVSHEIIPESHRQGHEKYATTGLMIGFVLMMLLDTALA
ncbi:ZIP family metal transporter [Novilysobacter spongiicola]|uniref:Zinc transporter, ZIP family n=1 Tax=Lysobacter spongiicola DSM 21749 TaxID=1122188 RepID=A0A1T4QQ34_9GAMM|nr:ZIP family metal transporter [Lysobacter spongiicola]SKA05581.1 zinc transporter, ZIP family [Lysobacter spongiicola DSM 21749]